jgi:ABC-2 type transport system permease protein
MTDPNSTLHRRGQLTAIADLRWRMFVNGLRSKRGKMELFSRIVVTTAFAVAGLGGFTLSSGLSWYFVSQGKAEWLPFLLWPVFFFWQVFPVMSTAFTNNPDSSDLLRFPLTYQSYFLIRLAYGFCDPASALGSLALFGIFLGSSFARPSLLSWIALALATFALFNLVLQQTIFAWLERWLAQRRTREIMGVLFILFMLSFQLIGPIMGRMGNKPQPELLRAAEIVTQVQAVLPPGLAAGAIAQASHAEYVIGLADWLFLAALTAAVGSLLHLRLRAQFRGENLSEAGARPVVIQTQGLHIGWDIPGLPQTVAAVFEKEVRYLARSGPMLLTVVMPVFVLLIFRLGPLSQLRHQSNGLSREMAFPAAAAYVMLVLTNFVYNSFGGDAGGIQFFYAAPVRFRQIVLGKNLLHAGIMVANTAFAYIAITFFYGAPKPAVAFATIAGLIFAAPVNFTAGNLLSIYAPRKRDFSTFGRQNVSQTTVLASLGVQIVIVALGVAAFAISRLYKNPWIAPVEFLALAAISISLYVMVLGRMDSIALKRRETLIAELCRA